MTLTKQGYRSRIVDARINRYLGIFGAVLIEGPKWCGKTWTALNHAETLVDLLNPRDDYAIRQTAEINPASVLTGSTPVAIDEWQEVPGIWDAVRHDVDQGAEKGKYLLTGSASPLTKQPRHSGAGRIARIRMRPMSLFESGDSDGRVSLLSLFDGTDIEGSSMSTELNRLAYLAVRGGWPANIAISPADASIIPEQYLDLLASSDISAPDNIDRDPAKVMLLIRSLSRNIASQVSNATLQRDIQNGTNTLSMPTISSYLSALKATFVIEDIPGWNPALRSKARIKMSPKRMFVDPSLAISAMKISSDKLLKDLGAFGNIFENMCMRDLSVYAEAIDGNIYHYRDNGDLEVDAIIELKDGRYGAIEIKLNPAKTIDAVHTLQRFSNKMIKSGYSAPDFLCVLSGGGIVQKRADNIYQIPITTLKP